MEKFNRIEFKYLLDIDDVSKFLKDLEPYIELDQYNINSQPYRISNVYYDSDTGYLARSAIIEPNYKFKIRFRTYESSPESNFLEIKEKNNGVVSKMRIPESAHKIDVLEESEENALNYIIDIIQRYELKPQSIITYDRIAYFEKENPDLRITFDYNIFGQQIGIEEQILITDDVILEIKTSNGLPQWLLILLAKHRIHTQNFSKYVRHYQKIKKK